MGSWAEMDFLWQRRSLHMLYTYQSDINPDNYSQHMSHTYIAKYFWVNTLTPLPCVNRHYKSSPQWHMFKGTLRGTSIVDDIIPSPLFSHSLTSLISPFFNPHLLRAWKLPSSSPQACRETTSCPRKEKRRYYWSLIKLTLWCRFLCFPSLFSPYPTVWHLWKLDELVTWGFAHI